LNQRNVVYFEDPFGRTKYDSYGDEITRNISTMIDIIKSAEDSYVVITLRDDVIKDFELRVITKIDLSYFQKRLL